MSVNGEDDCVGRAHDGAINRIFGCGLTLAAMVGRPDLNDDLAQLLGDVIEELDMAVNAVRHAAFSTLVGDRGPLAVRSPQHATSVVEPDPAAGLRATHAAARRRLRRIADDGVFAYAMRGHDFYRAADHILWAHESDDLLLSARSGTPLARRVDDVFYDLQTNVPLYYEDSQAGALTVRSCAGSLAAAPGSCPSPPIVEAAVE
jgi:hypothetical protein